MKTDFHAYPNGRGTRSVVQRGATLTEIMVTTAVLSLVVLGLVYTQMFCLRLDELINSKLGASDSSRRGFDQLTTDIRSAKTWFIGNGSQNAFAACGNATNQVGNALQISFSTDTNSYVRYYFDTNNCRLCRMTSTNDAQYKIVAQSLTNSSGQGMSFVAQKYDGTQLADLQFKYVIVTTLEFCQYQYPLTRVGPGYYYDYYRIQFKTTSHNYN